MKTVSCPQCRKEAPWQNNPFRPFCSERCKLIDLGVWATEGYRIPVAESLEPAIDSEKKENESD